MPTTNLTVCIGRIEFNCTVDWTECPGEPMVRYYPDGSGYPGCDASVDCIDSVECNECEWPMGWTDFDDQGRLVDQCDGWGYSDLSDRPGVKAIAERWICDELSGGAYDSELMEDADYPEDYGYDG